MLDLVDQVESRHEFIKRQLDIERAPDGIFLKVEWLGLPDSRDHIWHEVAELHKDVPDILTDFLKENPKRPLPRAVAKHRISV